MRENATGKEKWTHSDIQMFSGQNANSLWRIFNFRTDDVQLKPHIQKFSIFQCRSVCSFTITHIYGGLLFDILIMF